MPPPTILGFTTLLLLLACSNAQHDEHAEEGRALRGVGKVSLPPLFERVTSDATEPYDKTKGQVPLLWRVGRTGASISVQPYLSDCLNLVTANEMGSSLKESQEDVLQVVELPSERRYLNVDTSTPAGLAEAKAQHVPASGLADVVISPLLYPALQLFDPEHKAKLFTFIRHPVERGASTFYHLQQREKVAGRPPLFQGMTLEQYAASDYVESNFLVRSLLGKPSEALLPNDIYLAKMILRQKFVVGLSERMGESLDRIQRYFGWEAVDHYRLGVFQQVKDCKAQYLSQKHISQHSVPHMPVKEGTKAWDILVEKNWADMALYEFALDIFRHQATSLNSNNEGTIDANEAKREDKAPNYAREALEAFNSQGRLR